MTRLLTILAFIMISLQGYTQDFDFNEMSYSEQQTVFRLFAPIDSKCYVRLNGRRIAMSISAEQPSSTVEPGLRRGAIWTATAKGDHKGKHYVFVVDGKSTPGVFAKAVGVNGKEGVVVDLRDSDPEGWEADKRPVVKSFADLVVYEMHHRDFSVARSEALHPGKFLALSERWATDHLRHLGVNAVHLLPSYDYGSVDEEHLEREQYNWGYDPVNYNVPEGSYSTDPSAPLCRIREFKEMVQALHRAGISVILDVVYNHTYDIAHSNFQLTFPDYYYRKTADGSYSDGSGCGNETASERAMMRRFMIESVRYWIEEYHIDGFRFDLMGCHDIETMQAIRKAVDEIDPSIFIYGEGWSAGSCALPAERLATKDHTWQMAGVAAFSDDLRDGLRGPFNDDSQGAFLAGIAGHEESIKAGIAGMVAHPQVDYTLVNYSTRPYALEPTQMIAYVSCHDDMCLTDRLRASIPGIGDDELIRLDLLAQTAVMTSQGVPFMLSGEELLRTKRGVHNSFNSPDSINRLDWSGAQRHPEVLSYYSKLISLRRQHPAFRLGNADLVRKHLEFLPCPDGVVAYRLKNYAGRDSWRNIIVVLNATRQPQLVDIPKDCYVINAANGVIELRKRGLGTFTGDKIEVGAQSATIIHSQR